MNGIPAKQRRVDNLNRGDAVSAAGEAGLGVISPHHRGEEIITGDEVKHVNPRLVSLIAPTSPEAERYRRLRHQVENFRARKKDDEGLVVAVTSPIAGDGKSVTSINLAGSLAQDRNASVLLVELDLRHPYTNIQQYMGMRKLGGAGVVDRVLNARLQWERAAYYIPDFNLYVMPSGRRCESPYEILSSEGLGEVLAEARRRYDFVVVDTAPVVLLPDTQLIEQWVDGFMVVVGADHTPKDALEEALNLLTPDKVLGLVFNGYAPANDKYYGKYGNY